MQRSEDLQFIIYRGACGGGPAYVRAPTGGEQFIMYSEMQQSSLRAAADSKTRQQRQGRALLSYTGRGEAGVYGHGLDLTRMLTSVLCVCACVVVGGGGPRTHAHTHAQTGASQRTRTDGRGRARTNTRTTSTKDVGSGGPVVRGERQGNARFPVRGQAKGRDTL